jgi:threonine dehydrogenase-like Zn-dependent dehydrogenase
MRALVYTDTREITWREEPEPACGPGEVLLEVEAAGICGSDMHAWHGHDPRRVPPLILGHEVAGRALTGAHAGRRVVVNPLVTCGACRACLAGRSNLCPQRELIGMRRPGAMAERLAIPERNLIPLPDGADPRAAALTEPAATGVHALNLAARCLDRPLNEARALVLGGGSVGLLAALQLRARGCRDVLLAETNPLRRESARDRCGLSVWDPAEGGDEPGDFDLVLDAVGGRVTRALSCRAAAPGGVIAHVGLMDNDGGLDVRRLTLSEITFFGTYTYTQLDLAAAADQLLSGALGDLSWAERRPMAAGAAAFEDLDAGRSAAAKILLTP